MPPLFWVIETTSVIIRQRRVVQGDESVRLKITVQQGGVNYVEI